MRTTAHYGHVSTNAPTEPLSSRSGTIGLFGPFAYHVARRHKLKRDDSRGAHAGHGGDSRRCDGHDAHEGHEGRGGHERHGCHEGHEDSVMEVISDLFIFVGSVQAAPIAATGAWRARNKAAREVV